MWLDPDKPLGCRGTSPRTNNTGVRNLDGQTYATTTDKQGETPAPTLTAPKLNFIDPMLAGIISTIDGTNTRSARPSAMRRSWSARWTSLRTRVCTAARGHTGP